MRSLKCSACGSSVAQNASFVVNGADYCEPCADKQVQQLQASNGEMDVRRGVDPTICRQCGMDNGRTELSQAAKLPLCQACHETLRDRPFPKWLQVSMAGLCTLLVIALVHGIPYFKAGRHLVRGERYLQAKDPGHAVQELEQVLKVAPDAERPILLAVTAYILNSQPMEARTLLQHHSTFEQSDLSNETKAKWTNVADAYVKMNAAAEKMNANDFAAARRLLKEAVSLYPQIPERDALNLSIDSGEAFVQQDYDKFLQINEAIWGRYPQTQSAASLASALACKFATTGNAAYRVRAEEMLQKASSLAKSADEQEFLAEYSERISHRLTSQRIIDKPEYDRLFRKEDK
jgi:hypothetical protein